MEKTAQNFEIIFVSGSRSGERLAISEDNITIGSAADCRIVLDGAGAKPFHAAIIKLDDGWNIVPESGNVVIVNEALVADRRVLKSGDVLAFGREKFVFYSRPPVGTVTIKTTSSPLKINRTSAPYAKLVPSQEGGKNIEKTDSEIKPIAINFHKTAEAGERAAALSAPAPANSVLSAAAASPPPPPPPPPPPQMTGQPSGERFINGGAGGKEAYAAGQVTFSAPPPPPKAPSVFIVKNKKVLFNLIIAAVAILLLCAVIVVSAVFMFGNAGTRDGGQQLTARKAENNSVIYYERNILKGDLVYRFTVTLNGEESAMTFHYNDGSGVEQVLYDVPANPVSGELLQEFAALQDQSEAGYSVPVEDMRCITVFSLEGKHTVGIVNYEPPECFVQIEDIIFRILSENRVNGALPWAADENVAKQSTMDYFIAAQSASADADRNSAKFIEAVNNYRIAIHYFKCFSVKPYEYQEALEGSKSLDSRRSLRIRELEKEVEVQSAMRDSDKLYAALLELRYLYPEDSPEHKKIRKQIFKLQSQMQSGKRGR